MAKPPAMAQPNMMAQVRHDGQTYPESIGYNPMRATGTTNQTEITNSMQVQGQHNIGADGNPIHVGFGAEEGDVMKFSPKYVQPAPKTNPVEKPQIKIPALGLASFSPRPSGVGNGDETLDLNLEDEQVSFQAGASARQFPDTARYRAFQGIGAERTTSMNQNNLTAIPGGFQVVEDKSNFLDPDALQDFFR